MSELLALSPSLAVQCHRQMSWAGCDINAWNDLAGDIPFQRYEWCEAWWRHYRHHRYHLFLLTIEDEAGQLLGIAPWYCEHSPVWGKIVRALGSGEVCSDYLTILCRDEDRPRVVSAIAQWLTNEGQPAWDALDLDGIADDELALHALAEQLQSADCGVRWHSTMNTWRADLSSGWEAYVQGLSKSRRERVRSIWRQKFATLRVEYHQAETTEQYEYAWAQLRRLHQARRQSLGQSGCFASPQFTAFHDELSRRWLDEGRLRLLWVTLDNQCVAAEYALVGGSTVFMYQSGIDPQVIDDRPGWLNTMSSLKLATDQGYQAYDFLRGDEPYKASWKGVACRQWQLRIVNHRAASRWRDQLWIIAQRAKRTVGHFYRQLSDRIPNRPTARTPNPAD